MMQPLYKCVLPPYAHQWKELSLHGLAQYRALWWRMRVGKSKVTIDSACALFRRFEIQRVLILAPNGVHENWVKNEIPDHCTEPFRAEYWSSSLSRDPRQKGAYRDEYLNRLKSLPEEDGSRLTFLAVNNQAVLLDRVRNLIARFIEKPCMLIVDESHHYAKEKAKRTQRLKAWAQFCDYIRLLSGTPIGNTPLDLYSQYELFGQDFLGFTGFEEFKARYADVKWIVPKEGHPFEKILGYRNLDDLKERIAPCTSVVTRKDCPDLPPLIRSKRYFEMTAKQRKLYLKLKEELLLEHCPDGVFVNGTTGAKVAMKLQQIASGFVIDEGGIPQAIMPWNKNPRILCLLDALKEIFVEGGKAIVWCQFRQWEMEAVSTALTCADLIHVQYHGDVPQRLRASAIDAFQNDPQVRVFLGQPQAGGEGLRLSAAKAVVWYSHTNRVVVRDQAEERGTAIGDEPVLVTDIVGSRTVDERILSALAEGINIADAVAGNGLRPFLVDG